MSDTSPNKPKKWHFVKGKLLGIIGGLLVLLFVGLIGGAVWLDSNSGRTFLTDQIRALEPEDGLRINIERIEGSIYGETRIIGLTLSDPKGVFFRAGRTEIDWSPMAWIFSELNIRTAVISDARLNRFPELIDTGADQPLLPDFDIYIGSLRAEKIILGEAITGEQQSADVIGAIDITSGRAMINVEAETTRSGDRIMLALNAEPERQQLDIDAQITAPADGIIAKYAGLSNETTVNLDGEGDWENWKGTLVAASGARNLANIVLTARDGVFELDGTTSAGLFPQGMAQKLASPRLVINGTAKLDDKLVTLDMALRSRALEVAAEGGFHIGTNMMDAMRIDAQVRDPSAISPSMKARDLSFKALLNGKLSALRYQYLLSAPQLAFGQSLFTNVRVAGEGRRRPEGWEIPVEAEFASLIGNGELAKQLASGFRGNALFRLEDERLFSDAVKLATRAARGNAAVDVRLASGDYVIDLDAQAPGFFVQGIGIADIVTALRLEPGANGLALDGLVSADLRRFDNGFLRTLSGGLPKLKTGLTLGANNRLSFSNLNITAPKLIFNGSGVQKEAATFAFTVRGDHDQYGVFDLDLTGRLDRPNIALVLDSPLPAAGLSMVQVTLDPSESGFVYTASGGSTLGPFEGNGAIVTTGGGDTQIRVDRLMVSDTLATGVIRPTNLGLAGNLDISGGGVDGTVRFEPAEARQIIRAKLTAENARFDGEPPIFIRTGSLEADMVIMEGRSDITAVVRGQGISQGQFIVGRVAGRAELSNGTGTATFSIAGTRGSTFDFQARADISPSRYRVTGNGDFEGQPLRISRPLELRKSDGGWTVSPTTLSYGGGTARVSGSWGQSAADLSLRLSKMPLSLLDIAFPDLGLGGRANGTVAVTQTGNRVPVGSAKLTITGLTRSGLILTSTPVDMGLNIAISQRNAAARGIIKNETGKTIGRFQGRVSGLGGARWQEELIGNPLFAEARFNGAAESLWRLTGVETFDLTGPVAMSANIGGTLANPQIRGRMQTRKARLESPLTGTVITDIETSGRFDGSRLVLPRLTGRTKAGGKVSGSGSFNFAVEPNEGVGITLDIEATRAALIARDDFAATVTGPIAVRSSPNGGLISGDVILNRSFFKFGRAAETVALPQITVTEINRRADERPTQIRTLPWRFDIKANARNRLKVEGLGLASEWRANFAITGPVDNFALVGDANMIRGNYTFAGRRFRLERGRIRFVGSQPPDPILDIEAEANLTGLNATINVTGTGNSPEISFASVPALPQDELLSRVLFGASISDLSAPEAVQLAAAVASLNSGGGLDPINQLRRAAGLDRLRILPSDDETGSGTSIAAGKYITRRTYVELITDGKGYSATRLEFQITRWLSILSSISTLGRQSANIRASRDY